MTRLTIYKSSKCGACKKLVPKITEKAERRGWKVETVDVEKCSTKECRDMSFVPAVFKNGKVMKDKELEGLMNGK